MLAVRELMDRLGVIETDTPGSSRASPTPVVSPAGSWWPPWRSASGLTPEFINALDLHGADTSAHALGRYPR